MSTDFSQTQQTLFSNDVALFKSSKPFWKSESRKHKIENPSFWSLYIPPQQHNSFSLGARRNKRQLIHILL